MNTRNPNLDLLRFVAANLVVMTHLVYIEWGGVGQLGHLRPFGDMGYLGVDVFFALSGYVISLSAVGRQPSDFLLARFFRIFPGLFFAGVLSAICVNSRYAPVHTGIFGDVSSIFLINSATNTQYSNPVFWTLVYEFKFYIMVSLLLLTKRNSIKHLKIAAMIWLFIAFILGPNDGGILGLVFIPAYAPCFILGILLSSIRTRKDFFQTSPLLTICISLALNNRLQEWKTLPAYRQHWHSQNLTGMTLLILLLIFIAAIYLPINATSYSKITFRLGMYSYPIYLLHFTPMLTLLSTLYFKNHHAIQAVLISYGSMLLLAIIFAELIEPRLKKILKKAMS